MEKEILLCERRGNIGTLIFNRPEKRNALSEALLFKLDLTLKEWGEDRTIRTVVITGAGEESFSSGYDIGEILVVSPHENSPREPDLLKKTTDTVKHFPCPTIAMMNGYAMGAGLHMAICCDIRIGAENLKVGMPPAKLGLVYHPEGLMQFAEVLGMVKTGEMFYTGRTYDATEAKEMGILNYLVPKPDLRTFTYNLAGEIAANAPLAVRGTKRILNMLRKSEGRLTKEEIREAENIVSRAFNSSDRKEGQAAFFEKRKPRFTGDE